MPDSPVVARSGQVHAAPAAAAPAVPVASGAGAGAGADAAAALGALSKIQQPGQAVGHDVAATGGVGVPVLIPSGTTDVAPRPAHPHVGAAAPARSGAAAAMAPASPRPAPAPPTAQDPNLGYDPNAAATAQIVNAVAAAQRDGKAVLLDFGASWCTACRALDKAMHTPKAQAVLAHSYHVVKIDLGDADPQHMSLATQYDALGTFGMPLLVVLNPDGTVRADSAHTGQPKYTEADMAAWLSQWAGR
jgi:thiol-disulfide isomerase/thioredoxin